MNGQNLKIDRRYTNLKEGKVQICNKIWKLVFFFFSSFRRYSWRCTLVPRRWIVISLHNNLI